MKDVLAAEAEVVAFVVEAGIGAAAENRMRKGHVDLERIHTVAGMGLEDLPMVGRMEASIVRATLSRRWDLLQKALSCALDLVKCF